MIRAGDAFLDWNPSSACQGGRTVARSSADATGSSEVRRADGSAQVAVLPDADDGVRGEDHRGAAGEQPVEPVDRFVALLVPLTMNQTSTITTTHGSAGPKSRTSDSRCETAATAPSARPGGAPGLRTRG